MDTRVRGYDRFALSPPTGSGAHGFGCDQNMWRYVAPAFEEGTLRDYMGVPGGVNTWHEHESPSALVHATLARMGVGVGEATASPTAYSLISDYFPKRQRATALAVYSSGIYLGGGWVRPDAPPVARSE